MNSFNKGWNFISEEMGAINSARQGQDYAKRVSDEIEKLRNNLELDGIQKKNMSVGTLKGFSAETWHEGTFNIDAVLKESHNRAHKLAENGHASVDIQLNSGENYSLKYYKTAVESVQQQAKNVKQAYAKYVSEAKFNNTKNIMSFSEYCEKYGYDENDINDLMQSIYRNQGRIIPSDQLEAAKEYLNRLIATESTKSNDSRIALYKNYKDTLDSISDQIIDENGNCSYKLTKEQSEKLAQMSKEGKIDLEQFGITSKQLITGRYVLEQSLKAGYSSAIVSLVLQVAPDIFRIIDMTLKDEEVDKEELQKFGIRALCAESKAFVEGAMSAALVISCQSGKLGNLLVNVEPSVIGAMAVLLINTIENSIMVASGKMGYKQLGDEFMRQVFVSGFSIAGGQLLQVIFPELPVLSYLLGSFLGGTIASIIYRVSNKMMLSLCASSGLTCFGLVDQNYELPIEAMEIMDIDVFRPDSIELDSIKLDSIEIDEFKYDTLDIYTVKRGIIGFRKIGYIPV